jgi:hypothetical protein
LRYILKTRLKIIIPKSHLYKADCEKIFQDITSEASDTRRGLAETVEFARLDDVAVVWKLARLGRALKHLIEIINLLHGKKVRLMSLQEKIDTATSGGKLIFHVLEHWLNLKENESANGNYVKVDGPTAKLSGAERAVYAVKGEKVAPPSVRLNALLCGLRIRRGRPPGTARATRASGATGG